MVIEKDTQKDKPSGTSPEGQKVQPERKPFVARDFYKYLLKKPIVIKFTNGITIEGTLLAFNAFEIQVELTTYEKIQVCKHAIMFYSEKKPVPAPAAPEKPAKAFPVGRRL